MKLLISLFTLALAGIIGFGILPTLQERWQDQNAFQRQQEALQLARQQTQLQDYQNQTQATAASRAAMSNLGYLGAGAGVILILMFGVDFYRQRRTPLVRYDARRPLVSRSLIEQADPVLIAAALRQLELSGQAEIQRAIHQPYQATVHQHISSPMLPIVDLDNAPELAAPVVPTFANLLDQGRVGKGNPLILGFDETDGTEISGTWLDLYSTAVAGMSGTGKTTSQRFLACQTALQGAKFAIIDPHAGASDDSLAATLQPLSSAFVCEPASNDKAILETVRYVADVGKRRIEGKDSDTTPLILWADELTALLGRSAIGDELAELLERVAQEYRKRFVFVCGSGQIWTASRTTSELRDSFASVLCHRMKRAQARMLLPTEEAQQVERLATGHAVLWRTSGTTQTITVPNCTASDVRRVANLLTNDQPTMPRVLVTNSSQVSHGETSDYSASASVKTITPEAARIVGLFLDGKDAGQVVTEISGLTNKNGSPYMRKLAEVQAVIRSELANARMSA